MRKKSIFSKIFVLITLISLIAGMLILTVFIRERTRDLERALIRENKLLAETATIIIETTYLEHILPFRTLRKIAEAENITFLWIVKPNGEIYYADDPEMFGKIIDDPPLGTEEIVAKDSIDPKVGEKIKLIISPIKREIGKKPWSLYLGVSLKEITTAQRRIILNGLIFFVLVIIFVVFISFYFSRGVTQPLEQVRKGAEIIGKGNFEHRIKIKTGDELEELGESINRMANDLKRSREELEEYSKTLEIKVDARTMELKELTESLDAQVKEKTKELWERIKELERFRKLTIGRELKMIELKKEIKKLKKGEGNQKL